MNAFYSDLNSGVNGLLVGVRKIAGEASKLANVYTYVDIDFANDFPNQPLDFRYFMMLNEPTALMKVDDSEGIWYIGDGIDFHGNYGFPRQFHFYCERELN